ncbi:hypothetical protein QBC35DRAFT_552243 [Podospora australis]|uniref:Peptidase S8/S53 domain-containing protein n=1 Tax=Podospora australis TaxID=1536484 RepID=A0AAN7AG51_9PEZI|nr:hypothetical protein QBC35DRAFT_552243 [Podospora australis]
MGTSTKANTTGKRTGGALPATNTDPAAEARKALKALFPPESERQTLSPSERNTLLKKLGIGETKQKAASVLHSYLAEWFGDEKWNDGQSDEYVSGESLKTTKDIADHLVSDVHRELQLHRLLAVGSSKEASTILHTVLDTYQEDFRLTDSLKLFIQFLLELDPSLPRQQDKHGRTPLFQVLEVEDGDETKREIVQFFCESKKNGGLESQEAIDSMVVIATEAKVHGIHLAIKNNIVMPENAMQKLHPNGDEGKAAWLDQRDKRGWTCLHIALTAPFTKQKLWWARKLTAFRPQLLGRTIEVKDATGKTLRLLTPLHHFSEQIAKETKRRKETTSSIPQDPLIIKLAPESSEMIDMKNTLKLECLREFEDEETCKQHIYHGEDAHEIFLTLEDDTLTSKALDAKKQHYNLDTTLKRVHITDTVEIDWDAASTEANETRIKWGCAGNTNLYMVFHWLKTKAKVRKVLQVVVDDLGRGGKPQHSDRAIEECMKGLEVETWAWKRHDIPTEVIDNSCGEHLKTLYLWCSGRRAVLSSWAGEKGLAKLKTLQNVFGLESFEDMATAAKNFETNLRDAFKTKNSGRELLEVACEVVPYKAPSIDDTDLTHSQNNGTDERGNKEHGWLKCMDRFAHIIEYLDTESRDRQISVALIDDGVKSTYAGLDNNIVTGKSFVRRPKSSGLGTLLERMEESLSCVRNYESSHTGHGTVMAYFIRRVCPNVKLYIAKLDPEIPPRDGTASNNKTMSFSIESAAEVSLNDLLITSSSKRCCADSSSPLGAQAILWAVRKKVDIISMSWAMDHDSNVRREKPLREAITEAADNNILLFCANPDRGADHENNDTYPLYVDQQRITCVGAATHDGKAWEKIHSNDQSCQFLLPGVELGIPVETSPFGEHGGKTQEKPPEEWQQCSGSSLSCALAAGLAAMVLNCALITGVEPTDLDLESKWGWLKTATGMRSAFKSISEDNSEGKWLAVARLFGSIGATEAQSAMRDAKMEMLKTRVVDKFFKEWKAPRHAQPLS